MRVTQNRDYFWLQKLKKLLETGLSQHILKRQYKASLSRYSPYGTMSSPEEEVLCCSQSWTEWLLYLWTGWRWLLWGWALSDNDQDKNHCLHYQDIECSCWEESIDVGIDYYNPKEIFFIPVKSCCRWVSTLQTPEWACYDIVVYYWEPGQGLWGYGIQKTLMTWSSD